MAKAKESKSGGLRAFADRKVFDKESKAEEKRFHIDEPDAVAIGKLIEQLDAADDSGVFRSLGSRKRLIARLVLRAEKMK